MFSTRTSAVVTRRSNIARPRGDFRLSVTPFLPELSSRKNHASSPRWSESAVRPGSPAGGSILTTSAPSHASIWVHDGPASYCVRSSTRIPASAFMVSSPSAQQAPRAELRHVPGGEPQHLAENLRGVLAGERRRRRRRLGGGQSHRTARQ